MVLGQSNSTMETVIDTGSEPKECVVITSLLQEVMPVLHFTRQIWNSRKARVDEGISGGSNSRCKVLTSMQRGGWLIHKLI